MPRRFDRPIFLVGCARSGTTLLAAPLALHPETGPTPAAARGLGLEQLTARLLDHAAHLEFSEALERKRLWSAFFGRRRAFADMGRELIVESPPTSRLLRAGLAWRLSRGLGERRLFLKSPTNSFRVLALAELFPGARFVAIHRDGRDVVASWGRRPYGFGPMGHQAAIEVFGRKWNETLDYLFSLDDRVPLLHVRYEDLLARPAPTAARVLEHCELDPAPLELERWHLAPRAGRWREAVPARWHDLLEDLTRRNNERLARLAGAGGAA